MTFFVDNLPSVWYDIFMKMLPDTYVVLAYRKGRGRDRMAYVWYFFRIVWYTLGAVIICGLAVYLCERLTLRLMGGAGTAIVKITSFVGTPVHELGHAVMCLLFGHTITDVKLWRPNAKDGTLGYVTHQYNRRNPYHVFGNLFIGIGPIFSGLGVMTLCLWLCFPHTLDAYLSTARSMAAAGENGFIIFFEGMKMIPRMVGEFSATDRPIWARVLGTIVLLSSSLHVSLSPADIKGAWRAMPVYGVLVLLVTVITALMGQTTMDVVLGGLRLFNGYLTALFVIVLVFSAVYVALALAVWLIRALLFHRRA